MFAPSAGTACSPTTPSAGTDNRITRLRRLGYEDLPDYLNSPSWRALKREYLLSDRPHACLYCDATHVQIRHLTYARVGGDELMTDLVALCDACRHGVGTLERMRPLVRDRSPDLLIFARWDPVHDFYARTFHRQMAAILALTHGTGISLQLIVERIKVALDVLDVGERPDDQLDEIEGMYATVVRALGGPDVIDELLDLA